MSSIEATLERIATALERIAANLSPTPVPAVDEDKDEKKTPASVSADDLREQIKRVSAEGHKDLVRQIIRDLGYQRLVDVPEDRYGLLSARIGAAVDV